MEILGNLEGVFADLYPYRWPISLIVLLAVAAAFYGAYRRDWHRVIARHPMATAIVVVPLLVITLPIGYYLVSPLWTRSYLEEASPLVLAGAMSTPTSVVAMAPGVEPTPSPTIALNTQQNTPEPESTPAPTATFAPEPAAPSTPEPIVPPDPTATSVPVVIVPPTVEPAIEPPPEPTIAPPVEQPAEPVVETQPEPEPEPESEPVIEAEPEPAVFEPSIVLAGEFYGADDFHFGSGSAYIIETEPGVYVLRVENFSVQNGPDLFMYLSTSPGGLSDDGLNLGVLKATDGAFNYDIPAGTDIYAFQSAIVWCREFAFLFATAPLG